MSENKSKKSKLTVELKISNENIVIVDAVTS